MSTYIFNVNDSFGLQSKVCVMCHQDNQLVSKKSTDSSNIRKRGNSIRQLLQVHVKIAAAIHLSLVLAEAGSVAT